MSTPRRIAKNYYFMFGGNTISRVLNLLSVVITVRALTPEEYGALSFAKSFPLLFACFADMGIEHIFIRELAVNRDRAKELFAKMIPLKAMLIAVVAVPALIFLFVSGKPGSVKYITILFLAYTLWRSSVISFIAVFKGLEKMGYIAMCSILEALAMLLFIFIFIRKGSSALTVSYVYLGSMAVFSISALFALAKEKYFAMPIFDTLFWREMLVKSWPLAIGIIAIQIMPSTDMVMISFKLGDVSAAYYSACVTILGIIGFIQNSATTAMFPAISHINARNPNNLPIAYEKAFKFISVVGLPFCICGAVISGEILAAAYGIEYKEASSIFSILAIAAIFSNYASFYGVFSAAVNKQKITGILFFIFMFANAIFDYLFMLIWKVEGIAVSTLACSSILIMSIYMLIMKPYHKIEVGFFIRLAMCLAAASAAAYALSGINVFLSIGAAAVVYFISFFIFKPLSDNDIQIVRNILKLPEKKAV